MNSCNVQDTLVLWVGAFKGECDSGNGPRECLRVYFGEDLNNADWQLLYEPIHGLQFEKGYFKKIEVQKENIENPPADASTVKYVLVKELEKKLDERAQLDGQWVLNTLNGKILSDTLTKPTLLVDLTKMRVAGSDGCNRFSGPIKEVTKDNLVFGNLMGSLKSCDNMEIPDEFNRTLYKVKTYTVNKTQLILMNGENNSVLMFNKE